MEQKYIEIMDTTLRDGEQTSGVSFSSSEKLKIAQLLLLELGVDRIEVASARVSKGEFDAVQQIAHWAKENGMLSKVEVLSFVDNGRSLKWIADSGCKVQNLLTKGSLNHLKHQLKKSASEHFNEIAQNIEQAKDMSIATNVYLEDWSNGMKSSKKYTLEFIDFLANQRVDRIMLPDTLGVLTPKESHDFISEIRNLHPKLHLDFHAHNDYDLSVGNVIEGVRAGADGIHLTVNGMGERAGNAPFASAVACIKDFMPEFKTGINEDALFAVSKLVERFSAFTIPANKPIVGSNVFTQTAGIHADGDSKNNLYFNDLLPERFGRKRKYALGKTSGKANITKNLEELGLVLEDDEIKRVTQRVIELGDKKQTVTQEDLPYIISDVLDEQYFKEHITIESYVLNHSFGLKPSAGLKIKIKEEYYESHAQGDGQFDAFIKALNIVLQDVNYDLPKLIDYAVRIPPGSNSDALCETIITWRFEEKNIVSRGLDSDQTVSAIKATQKMLNTIYK
jgi:D-citramalate synthase